MNSTQSVISVWKPEGITPLEAITLFRAQYPQYAKSRIGYAGRLDPMAEGILLILVGEENLKRKNYERLHKTYEVEILLGIESDTYDILGIPQIRSNVTIPSEQDIRQTIEACVGTREQPYPPYSSIRIGGKSLFWYARNNMLDTVNIPSKSITICSIDVSETSIISQHALLASVMKRIQKVHGNFRQETILNSWKATGEKEGQYKVFACTIHCSSGTYIRQLVHDVGKSLGCGALVYRLIRTKIGEEYTKDTCMRVTLPDNW